MSCKDCPETHNNGIHYIVYTGGPKHAPFATMRVLPKPTGEIIRRFTYPTIHPDGRIEYPADGPVPPIPEGYQATTPWVLKPVWIFCSLRAYCVRLHDEGYLDIVGKCLIDAPSAGRIRRANDDTCTDTFCQNCPKRISI